MGQELTWIYAKGEEKGICIMFILYFFVLYNFILHHN